MVKEKVKKKKSKKGKLQIVAFKKEETQKIAKLLGFDLRKTKCVFCKKRLGKEDIGHFVHHKKRRVVLCDNLGCWIKWLTKEKADVLGLKTTNKKEEK